MSAIGKIYYGSIYPSEKNIRSDKAYARATNKADQQYQYLCERLSEDDRARLNKLISCYEKKPERRQFYYFEAGFKTGLSVAVQSLE